MNKLTELTYACERIIILLWIRICVMYPFKWAHAGWAMSKWGKKRDGKGSQIMNFSIQVPMCSCILCKFSIKRYLIFDIIKQFSNVWRQILLIQFFFFEWEGRTLSDMMNARSDEEDEKKKKWWKQTNYYYHFDTNQGFGRRIPSLPEAACHSNPSTFIYICIFVFS